MTISTTTISKSYSGNGSTHSFAYDFKIFADADLTVIIRSSTGVETVNFIKRYYPGASLWYSRLAMERVVWDQLSTMTDPKIKAKRRRLEKRQKKLYGNSYWWRPGRTEPRRGPRFDNLTR